MSQALLEVAHRIGHRLAGASVQSAGERSWTFDVWREPMGMPKTESDIGNLYSGSGGIAMFLGELAARTDDARLRQAAVEGMRHALRVAANERSPIGFYVGALGIAFAADRTGRRLGESELIEGAARVVAVVSRSRSPAGALDVVSGAAGAIPALLLLAESDVPHAGALVAGLAAGLVRSAHRLPIGWAWGDGSGCKRYMTGYSHGTTGIGLALLEAAMASGDGSLVFAAQQAFAYDRASYDAGQANWLDFRHSDLMRFVLRGMMQAAGNEIRAGRRFEWSGTPAMLAWCHGAPGVGLARLRAADLTQDAADWEVATGAASVTALDLARRSMVGYSLCHGRAGNSDLLLDIGRRGYPAYLDAVSDCLMEGAERFERRGLPWPSGAVLGKPHPSLLLGDAGIGWQCLRVVDADTPSVLVLRPAHAHRVLPVVPDEVIEENARHWQPATSVVCAALPPSSFRYPMPPAATTPLERLICEMRLAVTAPLKETPLADARSENAPSTEALSAVSLSILVDAQRIDYACMLLCGPDLDLLDEQHESLAASATGASLDADWADESARWTLSTRARLVPATYDWSGTAAGTVAHAWPPPLLAEGAKLLIVRRGVTCRVTALGAFATLVLEPFERPMALEEALAHVARNVSGPLAVLRGVHREQVRQAVQRGLLVRAWSANQTRAPLELDHIVPA